MILGSFRRRGPFAFSGGQVYAVGRCRSPKWEIQTQLRKENFHETPGPEACSPVFAWWYRCVCGFSSRPLSYLSHLSAPGPPLRRVLFLQLQPIVLIEMSGPRLHSAPVARLMCWCGQSDLNHLLTRVTLHLAVQGARLAFLALGSATVMHGR